MAESKYKRLNLLLAHEDPMNLDLLEIRFDNKRRYKIHSANSTDEAKEVLEKEKVDFVISGYFSLLDYLVDEESGSSKVPIVVTDHILNEGSLQKKIREHCEDKFGSYDPENQKIAATTLWIRGAGHEPEKWLEKFVREYGETGIFNPLSKDYKDQLFRNIKSSS